MEWVEVKGKTVEVAVEAALKELGLDSAERAEVEVVQQPERGFLGLGGRDAIVRVKPRPKRRRRRRKRGGGEGGDKQPGDKAGKGRQRQETGRGGSPSRAKEGSRGGGRDGDRSGRRHQDRPKKPERRREESPVVDIEDQVPVVKEFLEGLVSAFGLDGSVTASVQEDVIIASVDGEQTEALVGPRGSVIEAVHELTKTVMMRKTQTSNRLRLDVAGYAERRRQALSIYAAGLVDQVVSEGGEMMLEPMSAADRKVIHDAVGAREGVESYSEGSAPNRYVVIAATRRPPDEEGQAGPAEEGSLSAEEAEEPSTDSGAGEEE